MECFLHRGWEGYRWRKILKPLCMKEVSKIRPTNCIHEHTFKLSPVIFPTWKFIAHSTEGHSESLTQSYKKAYIENYTYTLHSFTKLSPLYFLGPCNTFYPFLKLCFFLKAFLEFLKRWSTGISTASFRNCSYTEMLSVLSIYLYNIRTQYRDVSVSLQPKKDFLEIETLFKIF